MKSSSPGLLLKLAPVVCAGALLFAANTARAEDTPTLRSPEVHADGTVTFRLKDPGIPKAEVRLQTIGKELLLPMAKDPAGIWTATSAALPADIYSYTLLLNGDDFVDPRVHQLVPNYVNQGGLFLVPGSPAQPWEWADVPHGQIHRHFYRSTVVGDSRDFYVYTPPGYDPTKKTKYPVFYLLHGFSDYADGWTTMGKTNLIVDNLIAQGKVKPMIIVMPLGYGAPEILEKGWDGPKDLPLWRRNLERFGENLLKEVIPQVEQSYRVSRNRRDRAIAGLSMGGAESTLIGLNNIDKFAWIGSFSGALFSEPAPDFPAFNQNEAAKLKLLWIACGTEDSLIQRNRDFKLWLKSKNAAFTDIETKDVAHTWMYWRRNLIEFSQLLFK